MRRSSSGFGTVVTCGWFAVLGACGAQGSVRIVVDAGSTTTTHGTSDAAVTPAGNGGSTDGHCVEPGQCLEYVALTAAQLTAEQGACSTGHGTWSSDACPRTGSVGTCARTTSSGIAYTTVYTAPTTASAAETACTNVGGTWTGASGTVGGGGGGEDAGVTVTPRDSGTGTGNHGSAGTCGASVFDCLCTATSSAEGQACITASTPCLQCIVSAQDAACPTQARNYDTCAQNSGCNPMSRNYDACLASACSRQSTAFDNCLMRQPATGPYTDAIDACTGNLAQCP